ncbi:uncharacterized protein [Apostichopus japonicus]|uniref:uncharacterized protein isoform X3 n=1 Tax=Stichopus japonicus TaxID=307972 RepID=UPI003AB2E7D6
MEDHTNLVKDDQLQIDEPRQYPGPQYPGPQYPGPQYPGPQHLGSTNTVITAQPVPHVPLALTGIDTNIYHAADNAKHAATLTCVALGTALILIIIGAIYNVSNGYY